MPFSCADSAVVLAKLLEAGFAEVDVQTVALSSKVSSARGFAEGLILGNPLFDEIVGRGGDPEQICTAMANAVAQQLGDDLQIQAIVFRAKA